MYPLKFEPLYKRKVWGGRWLEKMGRVLPGGEGNLIGESWEICDLAETSASGGGGGEAVSVVKNGPLAGRSLHEVMGQWGRGLMGDVRLCEGRFPLLLKYLDAKENLSVQVHPSTAYAKVHEWAKLKSEAWYIVEASVGALIYRGVREGVTKEQLELAARGGNLGDLLEAVPARAGECFYLPSGTCHALGAGILVAEVQTASDTTFRLYDWERGDREMHLGDAIECIDFGRFEGEKHQPGTVVEGEGSRVETLVHCEHFRMEKLEYNPGYKGRIEGMMQPLLWMVVRGSGEIMCKHEDVGAGITEFVGAETILLPGGLDGGRFEVGDEGAEILQVSFPGAMDGVMA